MGVYLSIIGVIVLIIINIAASVYIGADNAYESGQKKIQIVMVWLVPVVGAFGLSYFLYKDHKASKRLLQSGNDTSFTNNDAIEHFRATEHHGGRK